jgi:hypothetical protein
MREAVMVIGNGVRRERARWWVAALAAWCLVGAAAPPAAGAEGAPAAPPPASGVTGRVIDAETGEALAYASVVLFAGDQPAGARASQVAGAAAGDDGTFRVVAPAGRYLLQASYLGYQTIRVTGVQVKEGAFSHLDVSLRPTAIEVGAVEVTAQVVRNSTVAILTRQQKAAAVSDGLSAQQIQRTPDATAAEALTRVTGLSLVSGRYVYVRGLGERYSATEVNGATIGTPEPNKRVVPTTAKPPGGPSSPTAEAAPTGWASTMARATCRTRWPGWPRTAR